MSPRTALISLSLIACATVTARAAETGALDGDGAGRVHSQNVEEEDTSALGARAGDAAAAAKIAASADTEMTARAERAAEAARSETLLMLMGDMSARVFEALGVEDEAGIEMDSLPLSKRHPGSVAVVFASSSIPLATLRSYAAQLEGTGGAIVLRGGVGGLKEMGPTVDFIMNVLKVDPACDGPDCDMREVSVLIDPVIFAQSGVKRVPAVAVVDRDPFLSYCERETPEARSDAWIVTYGDASLEGHLEELVRRGEKRARPLLAQLRQETLE